MTDRLRDQDLLLTLPVYLTFPLSNQKHAHFEAVCVFLISLREDYETIEKELVTVLGRKIKFIQQT